MNKVFLLLILLLSFEVKSQSCDSLSNEGVSFNIPIETLEKLVKANCDKAKLSLGYDLLQGYRIKKDSIRAIKLLNECKENDVDCKYELFKVYYETDPKIAYKLICEIDLLDTMKCYWDSAMVVNARLIAAAMVEEHLGNNEDLSMAGVWYILYYELDFDDKYADGFKGMKEEMERVLKLLTAQQLDAAFIEAQGLLGRKPRFQRNMIE